MRGDACVSGLEFPKGFDSKRWGCHRSASTPSLAGAEARGQPAEARGMRAVQQNYPLGAIPDVGAQEDSAALATFARRNR